MQARSDPELGASAQALADALRNAGHRIAIAESCTGGLISKLLTDLPGSSVWFERGIVSYSNLAKQDLLGVSPATIEQFGAVSAPVVMEMASGLLARAPVDWALAVSGIAGPDGGTAEKPVGTVWIAFAGVKINVSASRFQFSGGRDAVRREAAEMAFGGLLEVVKGVDR